MVVSSQTAQTETGGEHTNSKSHNSNSRLTQDYPIYLQSSNNTVLKLISDQFDDTSLVIGEG